MAIRRTGCSPPITNRQYAKLVSYRAVEALLKATTKTVGMPGLPASLTARSGRIGELNTLSETQLQPTRPQIAWRDERRQEMIECCLAVAGVVGTHAHRQNLREVTPATTPLVTASAGPAPTAAEKRAA